MLDCSGSKLPEGGMTAGDLSATSLHDSPAGGEASVTGSLLASASTLCGSVLSGEGTSMALPKDCIWTSGPWGWMTCSSCGGYVCEIRSMNSECSTVNQILNPQQLILWIGHQKLFLWSRVSDLFRCAADDACPMSYHYILVDESQNHTTAVPPTTTTKGTFVPFLISPVCHNIPCLELPGDIWTRS